MKNGTMEKKKEGAELHRERRCGEGEAEKEIVRETERSLHLLIYSPHGSNAGASSFIQVSDICGRKPSI